MKQNKIPFKMVATPKAKKPAAKAAAHPPYKNMVVAAIAALKSRGGSSRQAIAKYIQANFKDIKNLNVSLKKALLSLQKEKTIEATKGSGAAGSYKLVKKPVEKKPKKKVVKKPAKKVVKKKPAAKKPATKKPKASPKKAKKPAAKKPVAKKPAAKKPAAKKPKASPKKAKKPVAKKPVKKSSPKKAKK